MRIKNLFNQLKVFGKKRYYAKNSEEELSFINDIFTIEICNINGKLDIVIEYQGKRSNYLDSAVLSSAQKIQIESTINAYTSLEEKSKIIQAVLLSVDLFRTRKSI